MVGNRWENCTQGRPQDFVALFKFSHFELVWIIIKCQLWLLEARYFFGIFNVLPQ